MSSPRGASKWIFIRFLGLFGLFLGILKEALTILKNPDKFEAKVAIAFLRK
jgi:hypothetical protein